MWDAELKCGPFSILNFLRSIYNSKFGRICVNKFSSLNYKELEFRFKTNSEEEWSSVVSGVYQFPHNMKLKQIQQRPLEQIFFKLGNLKMF